MVVIFLSIRTGMGKEKIGRGRNVHAIDVFTSACIYSRLRLTTAINRKMREHEGEIESEREREK